MSPRCDACINCSGIPHPTEHVWICVLNPEQTITDPAIPPDCPLMPKVRPAVPEQPPAQSDGPRIVDLVVADLQQRPGRLTLPSGRNALLAAYEDALRVACWLRQAIEEGKR